MDTFAIVGGYTGANVFSPVVAVFNVETEAFDIVEGTALAYPRMYSAAMVVSTEDFPQCAPLK